MVWRMKLHGAGAKVLMVNTDGPAWGGRLSDLDDVVVSARDPPPQGQTASSKGI